MSATDSTFRLGEATLLREAAAQYRCWKHGIPDCSPMLNGCSIPIKVDKALRAAAERLDPA